MKYTDTEEQQFLITFFMLEIMECNMVYYFCIYLECVIYIQNYEIKYKFVNGRVSFLFIRIIETKSVEGSASHSLIKT